MTPSTLWKISDGNPSIESCLAGELGISAIMSRVLVNRGITSAEDAKKFLFPSLADLHNPFLLSDMERGVERVADAVVKNELIAIFGDYDVDGITSTAILCDFFRTLGGRVIRHIPDRINEGYGLNKKTIDFFKSRGVSLVVTVDCGISNHEEIEYASRLHMDTIVIDHHEVPDIIPAALAVINQNRKDNDFPFRDLAGVGVAFNFLIALRASLRKRGFWRHNPCPNLKKYLDLVALGTIGDLVPLIDENRIFAKIGLSVMDDGARHGIQALKIVSGMENNGTTSESAAFRLIPRLNAAGRVGTPEDAVRLLLAENNEEALAIALKLDQLNRERQDIEREIFMDAVKKIEANRDLFNNNSLVLSSPQWHPGVIGIVASKLVDRYYRPVLLISLKNGIGRGSGRSIAEFNLYEGLESACSSLLLAFGGHRYAVGVTVKEEDIVELASRFAEEVKRNVGDECPVAPINVDGECSLHEIDYPVLSQLEMLAPFGNMNPEPFFCARHVKVTSHTVVGTGHLRLTVNDKGVEHECIWFNMGHLYGTIDKDPIDIVFTPQINRWRGGASIQLKIHDARHSEQPHFP